MENSILKRLIAVVCAISITMTGTTVLADELRVEENDNADIEVCISGDWETGDDLDCAEDISNKEVNPSFDKPKQISDSKLPDDNSILESNDFLSDDVTNGIQEDAVEDNAKLENITFEDNNQEVFVGAASHTRDEAVAWANSQLNKSFDYDGAYGAQCVDFIYYYYVYLGQAAPGGNANQFVNGGRYTPSGWSYQSSPLPGDIAVWTTGSYGHVAIVTEIRGSQMVCVEQNHSNRQYVTPNLHNIDAQTYIRPDFPNPDNSGPSYSDFHVGELREGAFTILAHVTDPSGIKEVSYAVWSEKNGQDDLVWYGGNCTDGNNYYWSRVNFSEHNSERGLYIIHMYAYDNYGNLTTAGIGFDFDADGPQISDVRVSDVSSSGYTVTCKVMDSSGVLRVQFPTWTVSGGQDDIAQNWGTNENVRGVINGDMVTFKVKASAHNNEVGMYRTHIYAYDILGNSTCVIVPDVDVRDMIALEQLTVSLSSISYTYNGSAKKPTVTVKNGATALTSGTDYTVVYSNNTNAGTATVTITGKGSYTGTISKTFTIKQAAPKLTFASTAVSKTTLDGSFTNTLTKTTDGTVTFKSSDTSVATVNSTSGAVTIKGIGTTTITASATAGKNYKAGSASYTLTVVDGRTDISKCTITLSATSYTYNGKAKKPTVTVKNGTATLTSGTDYTVAYSNNTNVGTATVKITGKGNYTGTVSKTFTIKQAAPKLTFASATVSKKVGDDAFVNELTKTTDGAVSFSSSNTKVATVNSTSGIVTIRGAGTATITVTAAAGKNYKAGTAKYTLTVADNRIDISTGTAKTKQRVYNYTGKVRHPAMILVVNSVTLVKDTDYTLSYKNDIAVGTATVTATGIGKYKGTISCNYMIKDIIPVYRLFNRKTGEHFYTASTSERQQYLNAGYWNAEGIAWYAPKKSSEPIYRLSNPNNGNEHHYTKSKSEKDWLVGLGWHYDCIAWYSDTDKVIPIYRHYHPIQRTGNHHYTTSKGESDHIVKYEGWNYEGIAFYVSQAGG